MSFWPYLIILVFLIKSKLILFNEEFLIFLCFVGFCFITSERLKDLVKNNLEEKLSREKLDYLNLINLTHNYLKKKIDFDQKFVELKNLSIFFKNYYVNLTNIFLNKILSYEKIKKKLFLINKFESFLEFEAVCGKLVFSIIIQKIRIIVKLRLLLGKRFTINQFKVINKVILRELLKII